MTSQAFDVELDARAVQALNNADAVAGFFTQLGYNTSARTPQTAANLGISEALSRPIKRIELLADHDRLLQVYLFEVRSVTVAHIRGLASHFRNFAGSYLLVLTSDYEQLDFVLLQRNVPQPEANQLAVPQATVTPRRISMDRRKPQPVHLRVLRRFSWTEPHPLDQFDKLRSAYDLAYWSEVYFNNRALFSDHYLLNRLRPADAGQPEFSEWLDDPKPAYQKLRAVYEQAGERFAGKTAAELCETLYEPVFRELGFTPAIVNGRNPLHARLFDPAQPDSLLAVCLPCPWGRELDRKDETRDSENPESTPAFAVVDLLASEKAPWVILTNGKLWRLYSRRAHSRATNYYEVDLDEVLGRQSVHQDVQDAFRYFWILFRMRAFRPEEREWQGKKQPLSMLDRLLLGSEDYARQLGESLKERVFEEVFPHLAEGFIANIRAREGTDTELSQERLKAIFQATLTLLYRTLFVLYAESRDLLPVHSPDYYRASLQRLKEEIAAKAGTIGDQAGEEVRKHFADDRYELWNGLTKLFRVIDKGDEELNVPRYNGGLFQAERAADDDSVEAQSARFLESEKIADRYLARALDLLARDLDPKTHALAFIDYKSLGVRHLGSIYEGLLEFHLRIADQKLAVVKQKEREVYAPFRDLDERQKERAERQQRFVPSLPRER